MPDTAPRYGASAYERKPNQPLVRFWIADDNSSVAQTMTPDDADALADALRAGAAQARRIASERVRRLRVAA